MTHLGLQRSVLLFAIAAATLATGTADAQFEVLWQLDGVGAWGNSDNWEGALVPQPGERALINNGGTAQVDGTTSPSPDIEGLWLGRNAGESGNFEMSGGSFTANETRFGEGGNGTATISGGDLQVGGGSLFVGGREAEGTGVLNVSGTSTTNIRSGDDFQLGRIGTGTMNLSGGQIEGGFTVVGKFGTGIWNQTGGLFQARNSVEIGDGGRPDQSGIAGPRAGTINLSGGLLNTNSEIAIGNRNGTGTVNVSGGILAAMGGDSADIYVGRGMDWGPGQGGPVELRVTGDGGTVVANGDFLMNASQVATTSTLVAELTGSTHTTIRVGGNADITNGILKVELDGYNPVQGDSWTLIEAGADLSTEKQAISDFLTNNGFNPFSIADPGSLGSRVGEFLSLDLPDDFEVMYTPTSVILNYTGTGTALLADFDKDGDVDGDDFLAWQSNFGTASGATQADGDSDGDGDVDGDDFLRWQNEFGTGIGGNGSAAVPEPGAVCLLAMAALSLNLFHRRRR